MLKIFFFLKAIFFNFLRGIKLKKKKKLIINFFEIFKEIINFFNINIFFFLFC